MRGYASGRLLEGGHALDHAHDVALLHDQEILAIDLDLGARPLAEEHTIAGLEVDGHERAALVARSRADRDDLALLRLLLDSVGYDDAALRLVLPVDAAK